ncbi:hypothetical protein GCM10027427_05730 [Pseudoclavibacter terrae]
MLEDTLTEPGCLGVDAGEDSPRGVEETNAGRRGAREMGARETGARETAEGRGSNAPALS